MNADVDLLFQSLANLLDNAIKFTPEGGKVTLQVTSDDDTVTVVVADSGPGVPPGEREAVLRRFYRLEPARGAPGSGLGLSLVAAVAQLPRGGADARGQRTGARRALAVHTDRVTGVRTRRDRTQPGSASSGERPSVTRLLNRTSTR